MRFSAEEALLAAGVDRSRVRVVLPEVDPGRVAVYRAAWWFRRLWASGITAVALPWGIYLHPRRLEAPIESLGPLMVHELTHIAQWRRLGPLGWARTYLGDYLRGRRRGLDHRMAYLAIGLEKEARDVARRVVAA